MIGDLLSPHQGEDVLFEIAPGVARETRLPLATIYRAFSAKNSYPPRTIRVNLAAAWLYAVCCLPFALFSISNPGVVLLAGDSPSL